MKFNFFYDQTCVFYYLNFYMKYNFFNDPPEFFFLVPPLQTEKNFSLLTSVFLFKLPFFNFCSCIKKLECVFLVFLVQIWKRIRKTHSNFFSRQKENQKTHFKIFSQVQKFHKESYSKQFESPKELGCE
jgi:hypothetical protein